ncbi:uncharacterized protein [Littorina saxatilis]|uniref:uncharacterized protein n=1 Tax=Littorina saxatilis TaxID=31220 RepID=UPI0038B6648B
MSLHQKPVQFRIGCVLHFMGLIFLLTSIATPDLWIYEKESSDSDELHGRSVWDFDFPTCTRSKTGGRGWRCGQRPEKSKLAGAGACLCIGVVIQLAVCLVLVLNEWNNRYLVGQFFTECLAGLAAHASVTGILIYASMTYYAVNLIYGAGLALNVSGILTIYVGLLLTGLYKHRVKRCLSDASGSTKPPSTCDELATSYDVRFEK